MNPNNTSFPNPTDPYSSPKPPIPQTNAVPQPSVYDIQKPKSNMGTIILAIFVLICLGGLGLWYQNYYNNKLSMVESSPTPSPTSLPTPTPMPTTGGISCFYQGKTYKSGESVPSNDCNSCGCDNGQVACTLKACTKK